MDETAEFIYDYKNFDGSDKSLTYKIQLPFKGNIKELCHYIIQEKTDEMMGFLDESQGMLLI